MFDLSTPSTKFNSSDFDTLISQLPTPVLLRGDFNAHSSLWGCSKTDVRGKLVEDLLLKHNLLLLNDSSHTYLHPATGSTSAIDLSISTPSLFLDFTCRLLLTSMVATTSPLVFTLILLLHRLQTVPGSYLKPTGSLFLLKHPQSWVRSAQMMWKMLSNISQTLLLT